MGAPTSACHPKTLPRPRVLESKIVFECSFLGRFHLFII